MDYILTLICAFLWMLAAHAIADYSWQTDFIALGKNKHTNKTPIPWYYILLSHALIQGGSVALAFYFVKPNMQMATLVLFLETVLHFICDWLKNEKYTNIHADQLLHVVCKLLYLPLI